MNGGGVRPTPLRGTHRFPGNVLEAEDEGHGRRGRESLHASDLQDFVQGRPENLVGSAFKQRLQQPV